MFNRRVETVQSKFSKKIIDRRSKVQLSNKDSGRQVKNSLRVFGIEHKGESADEPHAANKYCNLNWFFLIHESLLLYFQVKLQKAN